MIICAADRLNTNPATNEIAAPAGLYGIHFAAATRALSTISLPPDIYRLICK
jgi:hypothetical protein